MNDGHQGESEIGSVEEAKVQSVLCSIDCVRRGGSRVNIVLNAFCFIF